MTEPRAKIYRPAKNAMQSGKAKTKCWRMEYEPIAKGTPEPLMGWNTMPDTRSQLKLDFPSKEEAVAYAEAKRIPYEVIEPHAAAIPPKAYAENFSFNRRQSSEGANN
jgi:hypothetical protein